VERQDPHAHRYALDLATVAGLVVAALEAEAEATG